MGIWTVLTREVPGDTVAAAAARTVFVREKFSWMTLFFAPLVLLRFRLWLVLAAYVAVTVLLGLAETYGGLADAVGSVVMAGFHLLLAFELPALRQRKLARQGYQEAAVLVAHDREEAELRFFEAWSGPHVASTLPPIRPAGGFGLRQPGVIGAFPGA